MGRVAPGGQGPLQGAQRPRKLESNGLPRTWLAGQPPPPSSLSPPPVQAGHIRGLLLSGAQGSPTSSWKPVEQLQSQAQPSGRRGHSAGRPCAVFTSCSLCQKGHGDPTESILAFHGVTSTSETMCHARLGRGPFPPRPYQCPKGWETTGRPGKTLSSETTWGSGQRHASSQEASTSVPWDSPSPATLRGTQCSGAACWPAWPSPYCLPEEAAGLGSWPLTQSRRPEGGLPEPQAVPLGQAGVSQKWGPRGSESGCPWGHRDACPRQYLLAARSGAPVSRMDAGHCRWASHTGVLSHPEPQDELAVRGQDGRAGSGP